METYNIKVSIDNSFGYSEDCLKFLIKDGIRTNLDKGNITKCDINIKKIT